MLDMGCRAGSDIRKMWDDLLELYIEPFSNTVADRSRVRDNWAGLDVGSFMDLRKKV